MNVKSRLARMLICITSAYPSAFSSALTVRSYYTLGLTQESPVFLPFPYSPSSALLFKKKEGGKENMVVQVWV